MLAFQPARSTRTTRLLAGVITALVLTAATVAQLTGDPVPTDFLDLSAAPYDPARFPDRNIADAVASASGDADATTRLVDRLTPEAAPDLPRTAFEDVATAIDDEQLAVEGVVQRSPELVVVLVQATDARYSVALASAPGDPERIAGLLINPIPDVASGAIADVEFVLLAVTVLVLVGVGLFRLSGGGRYVITGLVTSVAFAELTPWELTKNAALVAIPAALVVALLAVADGRVSLPVLACATAASAASLLPVLAVAPGEVVRPIGHLATVASLQGRVDELQRVAAIVAVVAATVVLAWLTAGPGRSARQGRRGLAWRIAGGQVGCVSIAGVAIASLVSPAPLDLTASGWSVAALLAAGLGRAAQLARRHADLTDVSARVADLGTGCQGDLGSVVGRALDDPTARVLHARGDGFVDGTGQAAKLPNDPRRFTLLAMDGETVGALVYDPGVASDVERLRATCDAIKLSLANERLTAEIRWQLAEVRASRQRFVQAEERARTRLERDLHDGAQQRLTAAMLELRMVQQLSAERDGELASRIEPIADALQRAIDEIRELARGVRPAALDAGLGAAAEDLAERATVPVTVRDEIDRRPPPPTETVAYFVISEALANATRHAAAGHVEIGLRTCTEGLRVTVSDDGCGIDPRYTVAPGERPPVTAGTGLIGLFDRVDAHGGTITIRHRSPHGTTLEVWLPCAP